jgi:hypothetical protein
MTETEGRGTGLPGRVSMAARPGQHVIQVEVGDEILNLDPPALHEFIKANFLHRGAGQVTSRRGATPEHDRPEGLAETEKTPGKEPDLVIAPGGPRPRDSVHAVGPNEIVTRNQDETYALVPKNSAKRTVAKKTAAKKTPAKKTPAKKTPAKKTPAKKTPAKKTAVQTRSRKQSG